MCLNVLSDRDGGYNSWNLLLSLADNGINVLLPAYIAASIAGTFCFALQMVEVLL